MKPLVYPPSLCPGDRVVIVSPSGRVDPAYLVGARRRLESWGLEVQTAPHAAGSYATFAGTVDERLADLQAAMDDPVAKAILCSRGGYGAVHLLNSLDFTHFRQHPKWLIGFSDITALHCLFQSQGFASLHSLMAKHLTLDPEDHLPLRCLQSILFGSSPQGEPILTYRKPRHTLDHLGCARGILRGGNFAVAYGLRATPYDIPPEGTVLFLEDVGERPHAVERMMYNLKLSGVLSRLSGLIIGQFTEYEEQGQLGKDLYGALSDLLSGYDYPVAFDFPVGHRFSMNLPLICGAPITLEVGSLETTLRFPLTAGQARLESSLPPSPSLQQV